MNIDKLASFRNEVPNLDRFKQTNAKSAENIEALRKLSDEFESVFLEIVLKSMRETVGKSELTDGGNGEQIFQSMLDSEYSKSMASQRMTGLSASIEKHLMGLMGDTKQSEVIRKAEGMAHYNEASRDTHVLSVKSPK